jgi:hypothetical protein
MLDTDGKKRKKGSAAFVAILKREQDRYVQRMKEKIPDGSFSLFLLLLLNFDYFYRISV